MASKEGKSAKRLYREIYTAGSKTIMPNEVPVGLNAFRQLERPAVARSKLKTLTRDHSNYVETPSQLAQ